MNLPMDQSLIYKRNEEQQTSSITDKYTSSIYQSQENYAIYSDSSKLLFADTKEHPIKINSSAYDTLFVEKQDYAPQVTVGYEGMFSSVLIFVLLCQVLLVIYLVIKIVKQRSRSKNV